jgi:NADH-quinone oxidoreductase subunit G
MCSRCVRFTREVSGTAELIVEGRGNQSQIDIFPGVALDNELSANVIDLCPVGALLDKDFLFTQRVWFLKETPSIDGTTSGGDNITIHHNDGVIYRVKPRTNMGVNKWWISDEVRYGWKFVHAEERLRSPMTTRFGKRAECDWTRAYKEALTGLRAGAASGRRLALMVSPMLSCEDAYLLARAALAIDPRAAFAVGPIPVMGEDKSFPGGYTIRAEKAPNARGVRRVLEAITPQGSPVLTFDELSRKCAGREFGGLLLTGNYPSEWVTPEFAAAARGAFTVLIDTLPNRLTDTADVLLPGATWAEKAGTFENCQNKLQAFEQAINVIELAKSEAQIALDLLAEAGGVERAERFNAANVRREMAGEYAALSVFETDVSYPSVAPQQEADVQVVEL